MPAKQHFWIEISAHEKSSLSGRITLRNGCTWFFRSLPVAALEYKANETRAAYARAMEVLRELGGDLTSLSDAQSEASCQIREVAAQGKALFEDIFAEVSKSDDPDADCRSDFLDLLLSEKNQEICFYETAFDAHWPWQLLYLGNVSTGAVDIDRFLGIRHHPFVIFSGRGAPPSLVAPSAALALCGDLTGMREECVQVELMASSTGKANLIIFPSIPKEDSRLAPDMLQKQWEQTLPQLLHVASHGSQGATFQIRPDNKIEHAPSAASVTIDAKANITSARLRAIIAFDACQLAFLNCCSSARHYMASNGGVARELLRANTGCVIATEVQVGDMQAKKFAQAYYERLFSAMSSRESYLAARASLMSGDPREKFGVLAYSHLGHSFDGVTWAA